MFRADRVTQITQYMYLNRQKCEKRYMIFMKISNKLLSEMVFFSQWGMIQRKNVKICRKKCISTLLRWQNAKKNIYIYINK